VIQAEPPNVNNYVKHTRGGRHYKTKAAHNWHQEVLLVVMKNPWHGAVQIMAGKKHEVTYTVYQGFKSKGDVDNYAKCILDALVATGVLKSDASVVDMHAYKRRDRENPRTEITVRAI
jgi:Holliday junction resolvase RusA-like endonuclease